MLCYVDKADKSIYRLLFVGLNNNQTFTNSRWTQGEFLQAILASAPNLDSRFDACGNSQSSVSQAAYGLILGLTHLYQSVQGFNQNLNS